MSPNRPSARRTATSIFLCGLGLAGLLTVGCSGEVGEGVKGVPGSTTPGVTPGSNPSGMVTPPGMTMGGGSVPPGGVVGQPGPVGPGEDNNPPPPPAAPAACPADSTTPLAVGAAPAAYVNACSSCHGATGAGRTIYPGLRTGMTFEAMQGVVRSGKVNDKVMIDTAEGHSIPARMPSFSQLRLSDAELQSIYKYLSTPLDPKASSGPYCLSRPEASWSKEKVTEAYDRGLKAWRTAGSVDGNACAFCHAADPMEFAALGYTDSHMYRRAFFHVDQAVVEDVIDMVHAIRARFNITAPPDPAKTRVFQPGGEVLPGNNSVERDRAFGTYMKDELKMRLMGAPINTAADADQAWKELVGLNLRQTRVGIPFNMYTEDIFNNDGEARDCVDRHQCDDHGTIADWISDVPALTAGNAAAMFAVQDKYLADPSLANMKAIVAAAPRDDSMWFKNKYRSVQMANWLFRQQAAGMPMLDKLPKDPFPVENGQLYNSIWMVGANLRDFIHNVGTQLPVGGGKFSVPAATLKGLTRNNAAEQLQRTIVPWFWLGFTFDPSTMNVQNDYVAEADEYFTQETFLNNGGYPLHAAFIVSKRSVEMMAYETLPRSPDVFPFFHPDMGRFAVTPLSMRSGYFPVLTNFAEEKNFNTINQYQIRYMPTEPAQRMLYQTYTANMYRMFLWNLVSELEKTPAIWNPNILNGKIRKMEIFLTVPEVAAVNGAQDTMLIARARDLAGKATVTR